MKKIFAFIILLITGCATPEYKSAQNECSYDAYRNYPIMNVSSVVTLFREVRVPTGQTNCSTQYMGNFANTQCTQIMRSEYVPYQQSIVRDVNAGNRSSAINTCAAQTCFRRFGNVDCKSQ